MKVYYDPKLSQWYHSYLEKNINIGGLKAPLEYRTEGSNDINFELCLKNNHIGPLIGILTARKKDGSIAGNGPLFLELQKKLISLAGISFIFTLEDVDDVGINGYIFFPEKAKWVRIRAPYPDIVYNRIPYRKAEHDPRLESFFKFLSVQKIPYFNPFFINKLELYLLFKNHPLLKDYLPETIGTHDETALLSFLSRNKQIYLKPAHSARGKGIFRVSMRENQQILLEGLKMSEIYPSFEHFWEARKEALSEKQYVAQNAVESALYDGKRFDFRILAHANHYDYMVTGVGIRQSLMQDITTHIPAGGRLLPYKFLQSPRHDQFIQTIVTEIGKALTAEFGYFGEFSIDAGVDVSGQYFIYEVNSKPMSFDETEIEEKKLEQLCRLFLQLTDFIT